MKKIFLLLILIPLLNFSQNKKIELDYTFGNNGLYTSNLSNYFSKVLPDGKIIFVTKEFERYININDYVITRLLANGTVDNTFGNNGHVYTKNLIVNVFDFEFLFADDGTIFIAAALFGTQETASKFVKLNINGVLDTSFGIDGILTIDNIDVSYGFGNSIELSNGNILFTLTNSILCISKNGEIINSFGNNGYLDYSGIIKIIKATDAFLLLTEQYNSATNESTFQIKKHNNNGTINTQFNTIAYTYSQPRFSTRFVIDKNENIYTLQNFFNVSAPSIIKKYDSDGVQNPNFGNNGILSEASRQIKGIFFDLDNNPILFGIYYNLDNLKPTMIRYTKNGILDTTFNGNGYYEESNNISLREYYYADVTSDNKIIVSGSMIYSPYSAYVARYKMTDLPLSTDIVELNNILSIYPNPVIDNFKIKINQEKIQLVRIYSIDGKLVYESKTEINNIDELSKGIYIVKVKTEKNTYSKKLIKE